MELLEHTKIELDTGSVVGGDVINYSGTAASRRSRVSQLVQRTKQLNTKLRLGKGTQ